MVGRTEHCTVDVFHRSVLARGNAGLPASLYNNSVKCMSVCLFVCVSVFFERSVPIGREIFRAVERGLPIGRETDRRSVPVGRGNGAFRLVGNRPIGTRSSSQLSKGVFLLVGRTEGFDWSGEQIVLIGRGNGAFSLVGYRPMRTRSS